MVYLAIAAGVVALGLIGLITVAALRVKFDMYYQ